MSARFDDDPPTVSAALRGAARLARDAQFTVRVLLRSDPDAAMLAATEAAVDVTIERTGDGLVALFAPRHGDRLDRAADLRALARLGPVEAGGLDAPAAPAPRKPDQARLPPLPSPRGGLAVEVDVEAYRWTIRALGLDAADEGSRGLAERLRRASPRAHVCGGEPALVVNDIGGLIRDLRARARQRGVGLKVNPTDCTCGDLD